MDVKTFKREIKKLRDTFIKANRKFEDGEICMFRTKKIVILRATGVNETSGCVVSYVYQEMKADGSLLDIDFEIYGYEWESIKSTGEFYELEEDIL